MWNWLGKLARAEEPAEPLRDREGESLARQEIKELNAFYYEVAMMKLNSQFRKINAIDTRTTS